MSNNIKSGYFVTKDGKLNYAENWYDDMPLPFDDYCDGLNIVSGTRDISSHGDGENYRSISGLFSDFVSEGQFNIKKLVKALDLKSSDYLEYSYRDEDLDEDLESGKITLDDLDESDLKDFLTDWFAEYCDIPAWVFTNTDLFAENFPYYCSAVSLRNYSSAGDWFFDLDDSSDSNADMVAWITRECFDKDWGTATENRWEQLKGTMEVYQNWFNGNIYGLTYREWDEQKKVWSEEEHIGGFIGDNYYDLEVLLTENWAATKTENVRYPTIPVDTLDNLNDAYGFDAYPVELNDGVLFERKRAAEELAKQPGLFTEEELETCQKSR